MVVAPMNSAFTTS